MGVLTHPTLTCDPETGPTEGAIVDLGHPLGLSSALTGFFCACGLPAAEAILFFLVKLELNFSLLIPFRGFPSRPNLQ